MKEVGQPRPNGAAAVFCTVRECELNKRPIYWRSPNQKSRDIALAHEHSGHESVVLYVGDSLSLHKDPPTDDEVKKVRELTGIDWL